MSAAFTAEQPRENNCSKPIVRFNAGNGGHLLIRGELSIATLPELWPRVEQELRHLAGDQVSVDIRELQCADSACLALFAGIRKIADAHHARLDFTGLPPDLKALLDMAMPTDASGAQLRPPPALGLITSVGQFTDRALCQARTMITFIGELFAAFVWAFSHPHQVRWREALRTFEKTGADAVPIILLLGFLIGVMLAFQSAEQTERYGVRTIIPNVVAIAVTRELGPLIAMLLLAGRTGSAFAAELGTMKVNQELSALRAMGINPVRFLAIPRVASLILAAPLLAIFCDLAGIIGGYTVLAYHGFSALRYAVQIGQALNWPDVCGGLGKTIVGACLIGASGCFYGIHTGKAPRDVGASTTRSVVTSIILIVALDGAFGVIYYFFGI